MERLKQVEELAALLDGEIRDPAQLERLSAALQADPRLRSEFDEQRSMKLLLAQLPEAQETAPAPQFLQTRVLGEIAARRGMNRGWKLKLAGAAAGGFALCLAALGVVSQYFAVGAAMAPQLAQHNGPVVQPGVLVSMDSAYAPQYWEVAPPQNASPEVKDFLEFASQAHSYSKMLHSTDEVTTNMAEAIQVLDTGGHD